MNLPSETLTWLESHEMKLSPVACYCLRWLLTSQCTQKFRNSGRHLEFSSDHPWLDHPSGFTYARKPTLLLLQPYGNLAHFNANLPVIIRDLHAAITPPPTNKPFVKLALRVPSPEPLLGWYSPRTTAIEVWNFHNLPPTLAAEIEKTSEIIG